MNNLYTLTWNIGEKTFSICGDYESLWRVYLALKDKHREYQHTMDTYIKCMDCNGVPIDLTKGIKPVKGNGKILISKGTFFINKGK